MRNPSLISHIQPFFPKKIPSCRSISYFLLNSRWVLLVTTLSSNLPSSSIWHLGFISLSKILYKKFWDCFTSMVIFPFCHESTKMRHVSWFGYQYVLIDLGLLCYYVNLVCSICSVVVDFHHSCKGTRLIIYLQFWPSNHLHTSHNLGFFYWDFENYSYHRSCDYSHHYQGTTSWIDVAFFSTFHYQYCVDLLFSQEHFIFWLFVVEYCH